MANLAANATLWQDDNGLSPPSWWNGSAYIVDDVAGNGIATLMTLQTTPRSGDTFAINFQNFASPSPPGTSSTLEVMVNGSVVHSFNLLGASGPTAYTYTFNGSETDIHLQAQTDANATYRADFSLTPISAPPAPVAPNESISMPVNAPLQTVTPTITQSGSPVTPTSLAIVSPPTHGTAGVSGTALTYTPNANFAGSDSFTYDAVYGGVTSNVAVVSVTVTLPVIEPLVRQERTHRLQRYYDGVVTCYVRSEVGPVDVSGYTLTATLRPYQTPRIKPLAQSVATQDATVKGKVTFPLTVAQMQFMSAYPGSEYQLGLDGGARGTLFQFDIDANGMLIYSAILELI
jgi:hypothetical protein